MITIPADLAAEVVADPARFRPAVEPGQHVLVLSGDNIAGLVAEAIAFYLDPGQVNLALQLPGQPLLDGNQVLAWALVLADSRPEPGTRILPLDGEMAGTVQAIARPPAQKQDGSTVLYISMSAKIERLALLPPSDTMQVTVRDRAAEPAWGSGPSRVVTRKLTISVACPVCGGRRGEPRGMNQHEDGERYWVQTWENSCGHLDLYQNVVTEAAALASARQLARS